MAAYNILFPKSRLEFSETATRQGIDNTIPPALEGNAVLLSAFLGTLDRAVFVRYGVHLTVSSAYRCPTLNAAVGGSVSSDHKLALAADLTALHVPVLELAQFVQSWLTAQGIDWQQIIVEFGRWVHVSIPQVGQPGKKQPLTAAKRPSVGGAMKTVYLPGFVAA
jgi:zinc D-Ala-D-Ala carboxypeptidase